MPTDPSPSYEEVEIASRRLADLLAAREEAGYGPMWNAAVIRRGKELYELLDRALGD